MWRAKGAMWVMKYRLPDGTESLASLGRAWVKPPDRSSPRAALKTFLDQQTDRTPLERISFERCADAFLESCREKSARRRRCAPTPR